MLSQPKSMIKPAFINQIQVADPDSEEDSENYLDFESEEDGQDVEIGRSFSRVVTNVSDKMEERLMHIENVKSEKAMNQSAYEASMGSPMMQIQSKEQAMGGKNLKQIYDPYAGLKYSTPQLNTKANKPNHQMVMPGIPEAQVPRAIQ